MGVIDDKPGFSAWPASVLALSVAPPASGLGLGPVGDATTRVYEPPSATSVIAS